MLQFQTEITDMLVFWQKLLKFLRGAEAINLPKGKLTI